MAYKKGWGGYQNAVNNETEDAGVSKYNASALISLRLHNCFLSCRQHWNNGNFAELNNELDVIWTEFFADATKEQRQKILDLDNNISQSYNEMIKSKNKKEFMIARLNYTTQVKWKWLFLKTVEKTQGLGKAYKDEFEDDFE